MRICVEALRRVKIDDFFAVACFHRLLSKVCAYTAMHILRFECESCRTCAGAGSKARVQIEILTNEKNFKI